jgi:CheY-like chemotaxis protein
MKPSATRLGPKLAVDHEATPSGSMGKSSVAPARARRPGEARRRALIVEADPGTRKAFQGVLNRYGMVADMVDNGVAAVARARRKVPDVIIMDLQLRDSAGLEVIQWLRSNPALRSTPVIVLTTNAHDVSRSRSWTVDAVLVKPVSSEAMESAIRTVLDPGKV